MAFRYSSQLDAFELYHRIQEQEARSSPSTGLGLPALGHALAGSAGTAISHLLLYPLDLSVTRLQVQKQLRGVNETPSTARDADIEYSSILDAVRKIYKNEGGLQAFYAGCLTDTAKSIVDAFLFFLIYTFLRTRRLRSLGKHNLPVPDELRIGVVAGALSKFVTTPISQIVTRKQTAAMVAARDPTSSLPPDQVSRLSIKDIALQIRSERGLTGFWAGYRASLVLTLNPALTFLLHNLLSRALLPASHRDRPGPTPTFLLAALSKAAATAAMYPVSLAKSRAQLSRTHPSPVVESGEKRSVGGGERPVASGRRTLLRRVRHVLVLLGSSPLNASLKDIYRSEGVVGLYAGLSGEVLKGFLGHGLTMLLKERIHIGIVGAYFLALRAARTGGDGGRAWRDEAVEEMGRVARAVEDVKEGMVEAAEGIGQAVKRAVDN